MGDDIRKLSEDEVVLLCNHQSTADTPLVMMALWQKGRCMANSMWIMDWVFRFTNFGVVSSIRRDFFIKQVSRGGRGGREGGRELVPTACKHCLAAASAGFFSFFLKTFCSHFKYVTPPQWGTAN